MLAHCDGLNSVKIHDAGFRFFCAFVFNLTAGVHATRVCQSCLMFMQNKINHVGLLVRE